MGLSQPPPMPPVDPQVLTDIAMLKSEILRLDQNLKSVQTVPVSISGKLEQIAKTATVLAALVALVTLAVTVYRIREDHHESELREWQEVAVYGIILNTPFPGPTFDEILSKYKRLGDNLPKALPREAIKDDALSRTLLTLISKQAIGRGPDGKFGPMLGGAAASAQQIQTEVERHEVGTLVVRTLAAHPGTYTKLQLQDMIQSRYKDFTSDEFDLMMGVMTTQNIITVGSDGKLVLNHR